HAVAVDEGAGDLAREDQHRPLRLLPNQLLRQRAAVFGRADVGVHLEERDQIVRKLAAQLRAEPLVLARARGAVGNLDEQIRRRARGRRCPADEARIADAGDGTDRRGHGYRYCFSSSLFSSTLPAMPTKSSSVTSATMWPSCSTGRHPMRYFFISSMASSVG